MQQPIPEPIPVPIPDPAADRLKQEAAALGFDDVGICLPGGLEFAALALDRFVELGWHGDMDWMSDTLARRRRAVDLWPGVNSVIMLGMNYGPPENPMASLDQSDRATISVYARHRDYHDLVKKRLKALARWMVAELGGELKVFVDTAPVMEKPLAAKAGLGWQGKHTNLVSRTHGSWLFLGAIFTTLDLAPDAAAQDLCGSCRKCLDICPTDAFPASYQLDARRCISYLTIEHKGPIPHEFRKPMGNRIYGCDDCLAVCPWNKFAAATEEPAFLRRADLTAPKLADLAGLDDAAFRQLFSGSPIKRTGRDRFVRNVLIAIGNSADPSLADTAADLLADPSPLVRGTAVWALAQLDPPRFAAEKAARHTGETDAAVLAEWAVLTT
jgi:epoxyqueuosine reductase